MTDQGIRAGFIATVPNSKNTGLPPGPIDLWRGGSRLLCECLARQEPDWLWVQLTCYNFSRWGAPFGLARSLESVRRSMPQIRVAVCAHEIHYPRNIYRRFGFMREPIQRNALRRVVRFSDVVFAAPASFRRSIVTDYGVDPERVFRLPIGPNVPYIPVNAMGRIESRRSAGWNEDDTIAVTFGLYSSQLKALRACGTTLREGVRSGTLDRVVCLGGSDAAVPDELNDWSDFFERSGAFQVLGPQTDQRISEVLNACDYGFLRYPPSLLEKSGGFAAMAMAGLPVLTPSEESKSPCDEDGPPHIPLSAWKWHRAGTDEVEELGRTAHAYAMNKLRWDGIARSAIEALDSRGSNGRKAVALNEN